MRLRLYLVLGMEMVGMLMGKKERDGFSYTISNPFKIKYLKKAEVNTLDVQ